MITGWTIEVAPRDPRPDPQCTDFLWVVTLPFRSQSQRYLDTSYGTTAEEAVRDSPWDFNLVLNCDDYQAERRRLDEVLWPYPHSNQKVNEAKAKLGSSPTGKGRPWIEKDRITPGAKTSAGEKLGTIQWIKFKVEITFPPSPAPPTKP